LPGASAWPVRGPDLSGGCGKNRGMAAAQTTGWSAGGIPALTAAEAVTLPAPMVAVPLFEYAGMRFTGFPPARYRGPGP
jgi:hypothetical protein